MDRGQFADEAWGDPRLQREAPGNPRRLFPDQAAADAAGEEEDPKLSDPRYWQGQDNQQLQPQRHAQEVPGNTSSRTSLVQALSDLHQFCDEVTNGMSVHFQQYFPGPKLHWEEFRYELEAFIIKELRK